MTARKSTYLFLLSFGIPFMNILRYCHCKQAYVNPQLASTRTLNLKHVSPNVAPPTYSAVVPTNNHTILYHSPPVTTFHYLITRLCGTHTNTTPSAPCIHPPHVIIATTNDNDNNWLPATTSLQRLDHTNACHLLRHYENPSHQSTLRQNKSINVQLRTPWLSRPLQVIIHEHKTHLVTPENTAAYTHKTKTCVHIQHIRRNHACDI